MLTQERQQPNNESEQLSPNEKMLQAFERWAVNGFMGLAHVSDPAELVGRLRDWLSTTCTYEIPNETTINEWLWQMGRKFPTFGSWLMDKLKANLLRGPVIPSGSASSSASLSTAPAADPPTSSATPASVTQTSSTGTSSTWTPLSSGYSYPPASYYPVQTYYSQYGGTPTTTTSTTMTMTTTATSEPQNTSPITINGWSSSTAPLGTTTTSFSSASASSTLNSLGGAGGAGGSDAYARYASRWNAIINPGAAQNATPTSECQKAGCEGFYSPNLFCSHKRSAIIPPEWTAYDIEATFDRMISFQRELEDLIATPSRTVGCISQDENKVMEALYIWEDAKICGKKTKVGLKVKI
ncbi:hypothetical protein DFJ77DRAFT_226908 [Powellomyces hirtus]|nr:hypothetical protein DFJ77DRAFT_226908 [Powellomyces hirtus]